MPVELVDELRRLLPKSDSKLRKHWANRIVQEKIPITDLVGLLHGDPKVAQRFTWLIGDLLETDRMVVEPVLPMLFDLRNQMPFPGMRRSVSKCLWFLGIPEQLESEAIPQLVQWLEDDAIRVGVKHFAAKSLFDLVKEERFDTKRLNQMLTKQTQHENVAHAKRMSQLQNKLMKM